MGDGCQRLSLQHATKPIRDLQRRAENAEREVRHLAAENVALRARAEIAEGRLAGFDGVHVVAAGARPSMGAR